MKNKRVLILSILIVYVISCLIVYILYSTRKETYPDFINGYTISMIEKFSKENNIKLNIEYIDSLEYKDGTVISQNKIHKSIVKKNDNLTIRVSKIPEYAEIGVIIKGIDKKLLLSSDDKNKNVYVVSEKDKVDYYLLDEKKNKLIAKIAMIEEDGLYFLTNDDYVYICDNAFESVICKKHNKEKVKNVKEINNKLEVFYEDNTKEVFK